LSRLPYDPALNAMDPYGDATPNRMRYGGGLGLDFLKKTLALDADYDMATQIQSENSIPVESFTRLEAGLRLDLKPLLGWPLRGVGSYASQDVRNNAWVAFDSVKIQGGLEYDVWKGGCLQAGYRHLDFNGVLPYFGSGPFADPDPVLLPFGRQASNEAYDQWAVGFSQKFSDDLRLNLNYGDLAFVNALAATAVAPTEARPNFTVAQGYANLELDF
jgi:hypothetical protein